MKTIHSLETNITARDFSLPPWCKCGLSSLWF